MKKKLSAIISKSAKISKSAQLRTKTKPKKNLAKKALTMSKSAPLAKSEQNPIIGPRAEYRWESWQTFNPGVVLLNDQIYFLYRAIGEDGISRLGYAVSSDGFTIDDRLSYPVYEHKTTQRTFNIYSFHSGGSFGGAEDPRLVHVPEDDNLYMTYTACDNGLRVGLTSISVEDFVKNKWKWREPALISPPDEVHKNWIIFPEKINGKYSILHSIKPHVQIEYRDNLEFDQNDYINSFHGGGQQKNCWDKWLRGAGAPPIKTSAGWLVFYHAMDDDWGKYKVGAMLLDLNDPTKTLCRAKNPVLEPSESYENNGCKAGIVYVSGAVVKDGNILVYYGGSDSYVCVAYANLDEFLKELQSNHEPKLKLKTLKLK